MDRKTLALVSGLPPFLNELKKDDFRTLICFLIGEYCRANNIAINDLLSEIVTTINKVHNLDNQPSKETEA